MKFTTSEKIINAVIVAILVVFAFLCLFPFYNSLVLSFNDGKDALNGGIYFWPREFTLKNYQLVFSDSTIFSAFFVSVLRTVVGTFGSTLITAMLAYAVSKKALVGHKLYSKLVVFTMYFSGGLIPSFILIKELGLMNSFWVYIIPTLVSAYNMIIFRSFFQELPVALEESAMIDGCNYLRIFFSIVLPLSKPVLASLALFTAVGHWNDWFTAAIYITDSKLIPLQTLLNQKINSVLSAEAIANQSSNAVMGLQNISGITTKSIVVTTMVVATLPIIIVYPFLQKYFAKGMMVGGVKG